MPAKKNIASSSVAGPSGKGGFGCHYPGKPIELLNEREFHDRFCLPNSIPVQLVEGDPMSIEKVEHNAIYFTKEQFNHPEYVVQPRPLPVGGSLRLYPQKGQKDIFRTMGWLMEHPERDFRPNYSLKIPGKRDRLVEWAEKASFACLNKLFEITAVERNHHMLLSPRICLRLSENLSQAREEHAKARQSVLSSGRRKAGGKVEEAPDEKSCGPSSGARPPPKNKKKKTIAKAIKVASPTLESSFTSTASTSNRSASSARRLRVNLARRCLVPLIRGLALLSPGHSLLLWSCKGVRGGGGHE
ncbi:hypothetical protein CK203_040106 [Vitis vinifera]|uniref:Uncharacterized protein n=1 Tax=Vitis vinifera TaxID=29760 RepID=A0A438IE71_VITVI|nr:hypothetical protein CK203_040106 [Vitis vinifera]